MKLSSVAEEMGPPAEEVIREFLDYLVDPLLPLKPPTSAPPQSNQDKVAKQMHAVVLLFNYFQRKQQATAEYLDFMSFCKLVALLKPVLSAYMPSMQRPAHSDSDNPESQFSVTEKAIKNACTISTSLDASRDIQDVNEWAVSKVAVFLVNSSKEKCALSFSSHTDGVWSIFETSVDNCVDNHENQAKSKNLIKRKLKRKQPTGEPDLQQLAFSALKEARGIERSHLKILEKHITYSLDKERTAACCFIIECRSTNQEFEFSVRDTIESLQGPLMKKISDDWTLTQLIEYYNVLPYAGILSSWFSRQFPLISSEFLNASISENCCVNDVPEYKKLVSKSVDGALPEMVDIERQNAENPEYRDKKLSYYFENEKVQQDACEVSCMRTKLLGDSSDVDSDKTYNDDNLAKSKSTEIRAGCDNGSESENVKEMNVNLSGKPSGSEVLSQMSKEESMAVNVNRSKKYSSLNTYGQEGSCEKRSVTVHGDVDRDVESDGTCDYDNLPKTKSNEQKSDDHNGPDSENVEGMDVKRSGTLSGAQTLPQRSKEEKTDINSIESMKYVRLSDKESNGQSSSEHANDNVTCSEQNPKRRVPEETCVGLHSKINNNPEPVSIIFANDGGLKETEQPLDKKVQPSIKKVDGEGSTSINSVGEEFSTFNSFERPAKEVKDMLKNNAAQSSPCKQETNLLYLYDNTNEVNSTITSLSGHTNAENNLRSYEKLANKEDLKLCTSDSQCESNSDLLCGNLPNVVSDISATIILKTNDTDDVGNDKPDLKSQAQENLEFGTTDKKPYLGLSTQKASKCGKMDSSLTRDINMPITDCPSSPLGEVRDESPVTGPKEKGENVSTKPIIVYNYKRKRSRNQDARAPTECANTEMETAKGVTSFNVDCRDKIATNQTIMPFSSGTTVTDLSITPVESMHSVTDNLLSVLALKETELSQAALEILLQKKDELCHQRQEIQNQIMLCDQSIQKILDGDENSLVLKVDTIINCCNDFLSNKMEVQHGSYNQAGHDNAIQLPRPKTISKPFPFLGSACQKLNNSDANICAPAGQSMPNPIGNILDGFASGEIAPLLMKREPDALDDSRPLKRIVKQAPENCS